MTATRIEIGVVLAVGTSFSTITVMVSAARATASPSKSSAANAPVRSSVRMAVSPLPSA